MDDKERDKAKLHSSVDHKGKQKLAFVKGATPVCNRPMDAANCVTLFQALAIS